MQQDRSTNQTTGIQWEQTALASTRGALARARGQRSDGNPFLSPEQMTPRTGESHAVWFAKCDAWWRGWDAEDAFRRVQHLDAVAAGLVPI